MKYFVEYYGNLELDPLDYGSKIFPIYEEARQFAHRMRNKGLTCGIYHATIVDEEEREKRKQTLDELTRLSQEMGFYDKIVIKKEDNVPKN